MDENQSTPRPVNDPKLGMLLDLDRPRHLRITLGALKRIEELSGLGIQQQEEMAEWSQTLDGVVGMLWAGLVGEDPQLTIEDVYEIVDLSNFGQIRAAIDQAVGIAMPVGAQGAAKAGPLPLNRQARRHPSTGTSSKRLPSTTSDEPAANSGT